MIVMLRPEAAAADNVRGWLSRDKRYIVLAVEASGGRGTYYRIVGDSGSTPALFEAELFELVDASLPECWVAVQRPGTPVQFMPELWARDGFWERFFDGDLDAQRDFEVMRTQIEAAQTRGGK